jgi:hypothetical protein
VGVELNAKAEHSTIESPLHEAKIPGTYCARTQFSAAMKESWVGRVRIRCVEFTHSLLTLFGRHKNAFF